MKEELYFDQHVLSVKPQLHITEITLAILTGYGFNIGNKVLTKSPKGLKEQPPSLRMTTRTTKELSYQEDHYLCHNQEAGKSGSFFPERWVQGQTPLAQSLELGLFHHSYWL